LRPKFKQYKNRENHATEQRNPNKRRYPNFAAKQPAILRSNIAQNIEYFPFRAYYIYRREIFAVFTCPPTGKTCGKNTASRAKNQIAHSSPHLRFRFAKIAISSPRGLLTEIT
jgi:hypothetical protein